MSSTATDSGDKENGAELAIPYGTRSRNRTGSSRPNYAEDKDYDTEMYDVDHEKASGDLKKSARQVATATSNGEGPRATAGSRKSLGDEAKQSPSQNGSKEQNTNGQTPNASQATAGASQPSRKRKAAANAQQASNGTVSVSNKRSGAGTQNFTATSWSETNMLTFTNTRARPQNGRLVADDGTVLEANGS